MSYWSHNPELYTEIIFKEMIRKGIVLEDCEDVEEAVRKHLNEPDGWKTAVDAESAYWTYMADTAGKERL